MSGSNIKCINYYFNFIGTQRYLIRDLPYSNKYFSRLRINILLERVLINFINKLDIYTDNVIERCIRLDGNLNIIFYVFNIVWDMATDIEKNSIVPNIFNLLNNNYYYIYFQAIPRIIQQHSWKLCQIQAPYIPPFSIKTSSYDDCILSWQSFGGAQYSISVNNKIYDQNCQYVIFLSNFGESHELHQIIGIKELVQIIIRYIYGDFLVIDSFSN
jgi:hypothetical protein